MPDYPELEAYNSATAYGQPHRLKNAVIELADAMRDELLARIAALEADATYWMEQAEDQVELIQRVEALEAELAAERGKQCDWLSEDCTDAATYIPEIDAVRFSQGVRDDCSTVYIGKEEADAILALLTAGQGATDE